MKNEIRILLVVTFILSVILGCNENFLKINPEQNVAAENAITDVNTLKTALNGVYSLLQSSDYYGRSMYVIPELMADNLFLSSQNMAKYLDYDNFIVSDEDYYAQATWNLLYKIIVGATRAITRGEVLDVESEYTQTEINQLVGEAYAIRALAHFDLVRLYAQPYNYTDNASHLGIPIINKANENEIKPARNTVNEVYLQINKDLKSALNDMTTAINDGRFTIGATKALAARVALYQEDYEVAIFYATAVINDKNYSLISHEEYMNIWKNEFNSESIFEIVNIISDNAGTNGLGHFFDPDGYADALVTNELVDCYDEKDIRLSVVNFGSKNGAEDEAYFVGKFPQGTIHDDNVRILRLAELYLIRAEAYAKNDQTLLAQTDVSIIARRANPEFSEVSETGEELIKRILDERRRELAFEGHRLFDLNRNKMDVDIVQGENTIYATYPNEKFILPVPLREMNANPNMQQNPGY
ncbi:RagB/SusD family nutrient uptake outer membrane protein [Labilibaculum euxinus]